MNVVRGHFPKVCFSRAMRAHKLSRNPAYDGLWYENKIVWEDVELVEGFEDSACVGGCSISFYFLLTILRMS